MDNKISQSSTSVKTLSKSELLLSLIAISGEFPAENLLQIIPGESYCKKVISALTSAKLIKQVNKHQLKGYKLAPKGKRKLLAQNPQRFTPYFEGQVETNRVKATHDRRIRLRYMSDAFTTMFRCGVLLFPDQKPTLFSQSLADVNTAFSAMERPLFYTSREYKNTEANYKIRSSRAVGMLLCNTDVFMVYSTGETMIQWGYNMEQRIRAEMQQFIRSETFHNQYSTTSISGVMIGHSLRILEKYLDSKNQNKAFYRFLVNTYSSFYFVTNNLYGEAQLKLLCDTNKKEALHRALLADCSPPTPGFPIEHDGLTRDGTPVFLCCLLDLPRLTRFQTGLLLHNKKGLVFCFDFQREMLGHFLGDTTTFQILSFEKFQHRFFPDDS